MAKSNDLAGTGNRSDSSKLTFLGGTAAEYLEEDLNDEFDALTGDLGPEQRQRLETLLGSGPAVPWLLGKLSVPDADEAALRDALSKIRNAQSVLSRMAEPVFWALCEVKQAEIYTFLPITPRNLKRAVNHIEGALQIYTEGG